MQQLIKNMLEMSKRQQKIIDFIQKNGRASNSQIVAYLSEKEEKISRFTMQIKQKKHSD